MLLFNKILLPQRTVIASVNETCDAEAIFREPFSASEATINYET